MKLSQGLVALLFLMGFFNVSSFATGLTIDINAARVNQVPEYVKQSTIEHDSSKILATGDFDNDGEIDLLYGSSFNTMTISYTKTKDQGEGPVLNSGYCWRTPGINIQREEDVSEVVVADVNSDNKMDIFIARPGYRNVVLINEGLTVDYAVEPDFSGDKIPMPCFTIYEIGSELFNDTHSTKSIAVGDVNNDGHLDVVSGNDGQNKLYLNNGTAEPFKDVEGQNTSDYSHDTIDIELVDLNDDGFLDVLEVNADNIANRAVTYSYNNQSQTTPFNYSDGYYFAFPVLKSATSVEAGDFDKDGDADIIIGTKSDNSDFYLLTLNSNNTSSYYTPIKKPFNGDVSAIKAVDIDKNGYLDIAVSFNDPLEEQNNLTQVYLNNQTEFAFEGTQGVAVGISDAPYGASIAAGDLDLDGDIDLVLGSNKTLDVVYLNQFVVDENPPKVEITGITNNGVILATNVNHTFYISAVDESGIESIFVQVFKQDNDENYGEPEGWSGDGDGFFYIPALDITLTDTNNKAYKIEVVVLGKSGNSYTETIEFQYTKSASLTDSDGDGMLDQWEVLYGLDPKDASDALLDKDGDTLTNLKEFNDKTNPDNVDTDNDGINDAVDAEPLKDNVKPVVRIVSHVDGASILKSNIFRFKLEAEDKGFVSNTQIRLDGELIKDSRITTLSYTFRDLALGEHVFIASAYDLAGNESHETITVTIVATADLIDTDADGMTDQWEVAQGFDKLDPADAAQDKDEDGLSNVEEFENKSDPSKADSDSDGYSDYEEVVNGTSPTILNIKPRLDFPADRYVGEGSELMLDVFLSTEAMVYPVIIDIEVDDISTAQQDIDFKLASQTLVINEGRKAELKLTIFDDGVAEGRETISLSLTSNEHAILGVQNKINITVVEENIAPAAEIYVTQGARVGRIVAVDQGLVSINAGVIDINGQDTHTVDWLFADELGVVQIDANTHTASFDPASVAVGVYTVEATVTDNGSPQLSITTQVDVKVVAAGKPGNEMLDNNNNGIADEFDRITQKHELQARPGTGTDGLIMTLPGLTLSLGATALAGDAGDAEITRAEVSRFMGAKTTQNTIDELVNVGGYFDFDVSGLPFHGMTVDIVIPLGAGIPRNGVYRKFSPVNGWNNFVENDSNRVSTAGLETGACPPAGSDKYTAGITPFDRCIQLSIEDGGPNDMDGVANGVIRDPGGIAIQPDAVEEEEAEEEVSSSNGGGGGSADSFLLMLLVIGAMWRRRILAIRI